MVDTEVATGSLPGPRRRGWAAAAWVLIALNSLWTFGGTLLLTHQFADNPPERVAEGLRGLGWSGDQFFWFSAVFITIHFVCAFGVAIVIFAVRPADRMAWFTSAFLMAFGTANAFIPAKEYTAVIQHGPALYVGPMFMSGLLSWSLLTVFFGVFPDGHFAPGWMRYAAVYFFFYNALWLLFPQTFGTYEGPIGLFSMVSAVVMFSVCLYAQVWRYRHHSTPVQRQQTKWFVFGLAVILAALFVPFAIGYAVIANAPEADAKASVILDLLLTAFNILFILWPISIGIAILRYRLWDIDLIIRRTLVYSGVSGLLALTYLGAVVVLQSIFRAFGGGQSELATVLSTLIIAALFFPLRSWVQDFVDRRFYRRKYDAAQTLAEFAATSRDEVELDKLTGKLVQVVDETMQPEAMGLWLMASDRQDTRKGSP